MRKLYLEVEVDWEDSDDVCDELLFEDTEIASPYDGINIKLIKSIEPFPKFWKRLQLFVENVQVNDPMSEEEKEMILNICNKNQ